MLCPEVDKEADRWRLYCVRIPMWRFGLHYLGKFWLKIRNHQDAWSPRNTWHLIMIDQNGLSHEKSKNKVDTKLPDIDTKI